MFFVLLVYFCPRVHGKNGLRLFFIEKQQQKIQRYCCQLFSRLENVLRIPNSLILIGEKSYDFHLYFFTY